MFEPLFNNKASLTNKRWLIYLTSHKKCSKICKFNRHTFKNYYKKIEKKKQLQKAPNISRRRKRNCVCLEGTGGKA
jgi:hypothetical protein